MKVCSKCQKSKSLDSFHNRKKSRDGKQAQCKECNIARVKKWQAEHPDKYEANWKKQLENRDYFVRKAKAYNIPVDELRQLFVDSAGVCMICSREPQRWLVVDHCHNSLKVRGILCEKCNQALGLLNDDVVTLKKAIEYLNMPR